MLREALTLGGLCIDLASGEVVAREGDSSPVTGKELVVLRYLAERAGRVVSRDTLLSEIWGYHPSLVTRVVDLTISRLRRRIEPQPANPVFLKTVHGEGYVLVAAPPVNATTQPRHEGGAFVGRAADLEFLRRWAEMSEGLWLTVAGPPGIGKSRLIRELYAAAPGSVLLHVRAARDLTDLVATISRALGLRIDALGELPASLARALEPRRVLLLLDGLDGVHAPAEQLRVALGGCTGTRVIATSRRPFGFAGEPLLRLRGLDDDDARALAGLLGAPEAPLGDAEGNPLAITLAAAASRAGAPTAAGLEGALRASWERLPPERRRLLAALSLFAAWFDEQAAIDAFGADAEALDALVEEGLLEAWGGRRGLHAAVCTFARHQLDRAEDADTVRSRYAAFHLDDLAARLGTLRGPRSPEAVCLLSGRLDDLDAAWAYAVASGDLPRLDRALDAARELVGRAGLRVHGERWFAGAAAVPGASPAQREAFLAARAR